MTNLLLSALVGVALLAPAEAPRAEAALRAAGAAPAAAADTTLVLGERPTVVAFFSVPPSALAEQPALPMVIADFQFYLERARPTIDSLQVDVLEVYGENVSLRSGERVWPLPLGTGLPVGYYLWSPTGAAYLCRGVRGDRDLIAAVREYLEEPGSGPGVILSRCERIEA